MASKIADHQAVEMTVNENFNPKEFNFCDKVEDKLEAVNYREFLKCLTIYNREIICRTELKLMVNHLLEKYPDLMDDFDGFLAHCESSESFWTEELPERITKLEDTNTDMQPQNSSRKRNRENKDERESATLDKSGPCTTKHASLENSPLSLYTEKSNILKLDVCNPSYHHREILNQMPLVSHKTDGHESVLNDEWVCVGSLCEGSSNKMSKIPYKECVFQYDEDRYELDMLLAYADDAIKQLEEKLVQAGTIKLESPLNLEDNFTDKCLSCIKRVYGDRGLDVLYVLRENPCQALPVILTRLKQKKEEWSRYLLALHEN